MRLHWEYEYDVPREALWRYLSDTDWINRHAGLPKITARNITTSDGAIARLAAFRKGPLLVEWEERPTIWRAPDFFEVERRYRRGPLSRFLNRTELVVVDDRRTRVIVDIEMHARSAIFAPLLPLIALQGKRGGDRAFTLAARLAAGAQREQLSRNTSRFSVLLDRGIDPAAVSALERLLEESDDRDLAQIRPYEVADRYGAARKETLRAFLTATRAGLFNLKWDVICSSCRGTPNSFDTLADLKTQLHCPSCNVAYGPQFDRSVEVTFNARPLGRGVDVPLYCIASPQRSAHVLTQLVVPRNGALDASIALPSGAYDINAIGVAQTPFVATEEEALRQARAIVAERELSFPHELAAGAVDVQLENRTGRELIVRIEEGRWPDTIATAAHVTALQEFRDMFSSEVLAPGLELGIESLAVLFTDLVGSTAMYSRAGDAPAFKIVTDHFDRMRAVIEAHDGAIVKTIGDAVMAVFTDPRACLAAALTLDGAVRDLHHDGEPLRLRVGFHVGPCIAMRANDRIDYFGTTVNLAARLQSKAGGGEVAMAKAVADRADLATELRARPRDIAQQTVEVKGFAQPVSMVRVRAD